VIACVPHGAQQPELARTEARFPRGANDDMHPGLKDRLQALCAFSGIALGAVAGFEMVIGAGFDPLMPGDELREVAPSTYVQVADGFWDDGRVIALASTEPFFMGDDYLEATSASEALLDGGVDDAALPEGG